MDSLKFEGCTTAIPSLSKEECGGFAASFKEAPGCMGDAGSPELAVEDLHNMFEAVEESQAACGQVTPGSDTEFLSSIPGMRTSIKKGMQEPLESSAKHLDW